jgi:hypothetical protein
MTADEAWNSTGHGEDLPIPSFQAIATFVIIASIIASLIEGCVFYPFKYLLLSGVMMVSRDIVSRGIIFVSFESTPRLLKGLYDVCLNICFLKRGSS